MAKYKDVQIIEGSGGSIYRSLPLIAFVLTHTILMEFLSWPLALSLAALGGQLLQYWIPEKSKRSFLSWMGITILISVACYVFAYYLVKLGWVNGGRA